jgi:hypothetical protein
MGTRLPLVKKSSKVLRLLESKFSCKYAVLQESLIASKFAIYNVTAVSFQCLDLPQGKL